MTIKFGSVCSGIEAASVAWGGLGWSAAWFSEIEKFPSAVLKHHYPHVPNLGDMTTLPERILSAEVEAPEVFCGGTPCQAFSVAGLRASLDDARGNLALTFCEIANAIDIIRLNSNRPPAIIFWENVPGVLNTPDNAFGCFLAGLAGEDDPLQPAGKRWTNAGAVLGPKRAVAWRVLDAQHFGLAQRRKRVFVVASARDGFDPAAVLFEWDGVRRDTPPSRKTGKEIAAGTGAGTASGGWPADISGIVDTAPVFAIQGFMIGRSDTAGPQGDGINEDICFTQNTSDKHAVAYAVRTANTSANDQGITPTLRAEPRNNQLAVAARLVSFGEYVEDGTASTIKARDYKDATDLVVYSFDALASNSMKSSNPHSGCRAVELDCTSPAPNKNQGGIGIVQGTHVRRLTPVECERLQGFPDNYTSIPWRKKSASECPDGPRYKALGNSWAVPVVTWIGERINKELNFPLSNKNHTA